MGSILSSAFEAIQSEYRAMGLTFSSAFEIIHLENRAVGSATSTAFAGNIVLISSYEVDIQLCIQNYSYFMFNIKLNIDLRARYSYGVYINC